MPIVMIGDKPVTVGGKVINIDIPMVALQKKDINFYDFDGTLVDSWTLEELQSKTALPDLPNREDENLTNEGWNWTLDELKTENAPMNVGCTYHTTDGWSYFWLVINAPNTSVTFACSGGGTLSFDYGDGTTGSSKSHTYTEAGEYVFKVKGTSNYTFANGTVINSMLIKCKLSNQVTDMGTNAFNNKYLQTINIPNSVTVFSAGSSNPGSFTECYSLTHINIPKSVARSINYKLFQYCYSLRIISLPYGISYIRDSFCYNNHGLKEITLPSSIKAINSSAFYMCNALNYISLAGFDTPPTLSSTSAIYGSYGSPSLRQILIKAGTKSLYLEATNWAEIPEYLYKEVD